MTREDVLQSFRAEETDNESTADFVEVSLLLFRFGDTAFGLPAECVDSVVGWRTPARLPCSVASVAGVVQDRGRLVIVLKTPLGGDAANDDAHPRRIIVCSTGRGLLGIPADDTQGVARLQLRAAPIAGQLIDTREGALVLMDLDTLVLEACRG